MFFVPLRPTLNSEMVTPSFHGLRIRSATHSDQQEDGLYRTSCKTDLGSNRSLDQARIIQHAQSKGMIEQNYQKLKQILKTNVSTY